MIVIEDARKNILTGNEWDATDDYALFHINKRRKIEDVNVFDDCIFIDLHITHKTKWGAAIPSTFQFFLPNILEIIMPKDNIIVLNVVDTAERDDFRYLVNDDLVNSFLKPNGYEFLFLDKEISGQRYPTIFFECSFNDLDVLDHVAYPGTFTDIEGFLMERGKLRLFSKWYKMGNTDVMFRDLIRNVYMAFRIWKDKNGMFIVTDKLNIESLEKKVKASGIIKEIEDYIKQEENYEAST